MNIIHNYLIIFFTFIILPLTSFAQSFIKPDTILIESYYISYYNYKILGPSYVCYKLYKGGGDISRRGFYFKGKKGLPHYNYLHSGFDKGHLVPAEDFAFSKKALASTFKYHNALPQAPRMNRGIWQSYEKKIRRLSQNDSLFIVCGGSDFIGPIPRKCWKVVYSLTTKKCLYNILIDNTSNPITELDNKLVKDFADIIFINEAKMLNW